MNQVHPGNQEKLTNLQLELLKGLRHLTTEKQIEDVRELLGNYFAQRLDESIEKAEKERGYTADTYKSWPVSSATSKRSR